MTFNTCLFCLKHGENIVASGLTKFTVRVDKKVFNLPIHQSSEKVGDYFINLFSVPSYLENAVLLNHFCEACVNQISTIKKMYKTAEIIYEEINIRAEKLRNMMITKYGRKGSAINKVDQDVRQLGLKIIKSLDEDFEIISPEGWNLLNDDDNNNTAEEEKAPNVQEKEEKEAKEIKVVNLDENEVETMIKHSPEILSEMTLQKIIADPKLRANAFISFSSCNYEEVKEALRQKISPKQRTPKSKLTKKRPKIKNGIMKLKKNSIPHSTNSSIISDKINGQNDEREYNEENRDLKDLAMKGNKGLQMKEKSNGQIILPSSMNVITMKKNLEKDLAI